MKGGTTDWCACGGCLRDRIEDPWHADCFESFLILDEGESDYDEEDDESEDDESDGESTESGSEDVWEDDHCEAEEASPRGGDDEGMENEEEREHIPADQPQAIGFIVMPVPRLPDVSRLLTRMVENLQVERSEENCEELHLASCDEAERSRCSMNWRGGFWLQLLGF